MEHTYLQHPFPEQAAPLNTSNNRGAFYNLNLQLIENAEAPKIRQIPHSVLSNYRQALNGSVPVNHTFGPGLNNPVVRFGSGVDGRYSKLLSPKSQMLDNIVSILSHKSIKNKKEYLQRYAFNKEDSTGCKSFLNTMNKLIKSKVALGTSPSGIQETRLNLTMNNRQERASLGRNASRAQSVSVKKREQLGAHHRQLSQMQGLSKKREDFNSKWGSTMALEQNPSLFKLNGRHLRTPDAQNQLAFMLSTQKKQIFEMNARKQSSGKLGKGDLRNYSPEDFVKMRRDQDAKKEALKIPSNMPRDYQRRKGGEDISHNSSQLGLPSEMTEKQYMYRQQNINDSTRQHSVTLSQSPQYPSPLHDCRKQAANPQNRQADVERHKEELLVIKKTHIKVIKPIHYKGNNVQQSSLEDKKNERFNNASSQKSIRSKYTDGDIDAGQYQMKNRKEDFPPLNESIHQDDQQLTPQRKATMTPNKQGYDEDYLLSRLPSFGGKISPQRHHEKQLWSTPPNIEGHSRGLGANQQNSETQTPTNKDLAGEDHPSQILQNARFQINQLLEPSAIEENLRNDLLSEDATQKTMTTPEAFVHQRSDEPAILMNELDSSAQQSISRPNYSSSHNGGENTPSFYRKHPSASRGVLQSANSNQCTLNPTYYYSKNRVQARAVNPPLKGLRHPSSLNEDIKIASKAIYPGMLRTNIALKQLKTPTVKAPAMQARIADIKRKAELEVNAAENLNIDVFTHQYRSSIENTPVDELDTAGKSDVMLQQELAMMSDEALLQALKPSDKPQEIQKVGSVCKFSSTLAAQEKLKRARTLPRKDFLMPDVFNDTMQRSGSPDNAFSPEHSLGQYSHHQLSNKLGSTTSHAYKRQQFKRTLLIKEREQLKQLKAAIKPAQEFTRQRVPSPERGNNSPVYFLSLEETPKQLAQAFTPEFDQYVSKVQVFMAQQSRPHSGVVMRMSRSKQRIMSASDSSNVRSKTPINGRINNIISESNLGNLKISNL